MEHTDKGNLCMAPNNTPRQLLEQHCDNVETLLAKLYPYALTLTHSEDDADDLLQDALLRTLLKIHLYKPTGSFTGWTKRIMENEFKNSQKKAGRCGMHSVDDENETHRAIQLVDYAHSVEEIYCAKELLDMVRQLPSRQQKTLTLRIKGYKYDEIAKELDTSVGNVKNSIFQARNNIKRILSE